jgi:protein TonB
MNKLLAVVALCFACSAFAADMDVVSPTNLTKKPQAVKTVAPAGYPKGKEGLVSVEIIIGKDGKVMEAKVKKSTDVDLEASALEAVKQWVFTPGEKDGGPVATRVTVPFRYDKE